MEGIRTAKIEQVGLERDGRRTTGTLYLTPFHLVFQAQGEEDYQLAYPLLNLVTRLAQTFAGEVPLALRTRTFEFPTLFFRTEHDCADAFETVKELTVLPSVEKLYAFAYHPDPPLPTPAVPGWACYSPRDEYARMGVGTRTKAWRLTDINKDYAFSPTYPAKLVVPAKIGDAVLAYASKYRSKERVPALTYLHWANFATITRCSQPMVGLKQARSVQDEKLVETIFQTHLFPTSAYSPSAPAVFGATPTNLIVDARPTTNAMANVAKGAGSENMENYKSGKKVYLGIDNIHVMRDSLNRVIDALRDSERIPGSEVAPPPLDRQALRRSGWLKHLTAILEGATLMIRNIHVNASHVLVHCSDGWDRTAQLAAVAELCLDPYYRTMAGFQVLVEKDFVSFGHKFLDRSGHLSSDKFFHTSQADGSKDGGGGGEGGSGQGFETDSGPTAAPSGAQAFFASVQKQFSGAMASTSHLKETSPVFHQFLDCVYQLLVQHPARFEFNELYLRSLFEHLYSCQFGTFLFNSERDRRTPPDFGPRGSRAPWERTVSAWDWSSSPAEADRFRNPAYDRSLDERESRAAGADMGVLFPNPRNVKFWHELFRRGDEEMNGRPLPPSVEPPSPPPAEQGASDPVVQHAVQGTEALEHGRPTEEGSFLTASIPYEARSRSAHETGSASPVDGLRSSTGASDEAYRPFTSTSSAFSLQPSSGPPPPSSSAPSSLVPSRSLLSPSPSHDVGRSTSIASPAQSSSRTLSPSAASGSSWGASWASLSTGAISALSGAAKEVGRAASTISAQAQAAAAARAGGGVSPGNGGGWRREDEMTSAMGRSSIASSSSTRAIPAVSSHNPWALVDDAPSSHLTSTSPPRAIPSPTPRGGVSKEEGDQPIRPSLSSFGASSVSQQWSFIEPPSTLVASSRLGQASYERPNGSASSSFGMPSAGQKAWRGLEELSIDDVKGSGASSGQFPKREVRRNNPTSSSSTSDPRPPPPPPMSSSAADDTAISAKPPQPPPSQAAASFDPLGVGL